MRRFIDRQINFFPSQMLSARCQAAIDSGPPTELLDTNGAICNFDLSEHGTLISVSISRRNPQSCQWLSGFSAGLTDISGSHINLLQLTQPGKNVVSDLPRSPPPSGRVSPVRKPSRTSSEPRSASDQEILQPYLKMSSPGVDTNVELNFVTLTETHRRHSMGSPVLDLSSSCSGSPPRELYTNFDFGDLTLPMRQTRISEEGPETLLPPSNPLLSGRTRNPDCGITATQSEKPRGVLNRSSSDARKRTTIHRTRGSRELRQMANRHATSINKPLDEPNLTNLSGLSSSKRAMFTETPSSSLNEDTVPHAITVDFTALALTEANKPQRQDILALDLGNGMKQAVSLPQMHRLLLLNKSNQAHTPQVHTSDNGESDESDFAYRIEDAVIEQAVSPS